MNEKKLSAWTYLSINQTDSHLSKLLDTLAEESHIIPKLESFLDKLAKSCELGLVPERGNALNNRAVVHCDGVCEMRVDCVRVVLL